ncbi:MAG TPA: hypothetical protein VHN14_12985 [Kofleriaceae bacterium]|nr:hypothetical protein [Kofleriaceae bacterium]
MPEQTTCVIAVVCEADADRQAATLLSDRVLRETVEWISPETLPYLRRYRGLGDQDPYLKCSSVKEIARQKRIVVHGFVDGEPKKPAAAMAMRALRLLAVSEIPPAAVILTGDTDKEPTRRDGYDQARRAPRWPFAVIVGVAETKRECWILAGYEPRDDVERELLARERKVFGFDPRVSAEHLTASEEGAKRDAKRVLDALTGGDRDREDACLEEPPLALLMERGANTGLTLYLQELEERLVPLFDPSDHYAR